MPITSAKMNTPASLRSELIAIAGIAIERDESGIF